MASEQFYDWRELLSVHHFYTGIDVVTFTINDSE